ncbi:MAG: hypothetical protein BVN30_04175 [Proteobacteria bacterium ST_bin16]|nr:MAG: hypothetical protein BVN30_04175 [Proteobacteria bacterium ST_bin16]
MMIRAKALGYLRHALSNLMIHQAIYYQISDKPYNGFATLMDFLQQKNTEMIRSNTHDPVLLFV